VPEIAQLYRTDRGRHDATAREWTAKYVRGREGWREGGREGGLLVYLLWRKRKSWWSFFTKKSPRVALKSV
jgi:hypothetical protein